MPSSRATLSILSGLSKFSRSFSTARTMGLSFSRSVPHGSHRKLPSPVTRRAETLFGGLYKHLGRSSYRRSRTTWVTSHQQTRTQREAGGGLGPCSKRSMPQRKGNVMEIKRCGSQSSRRGPVDNFTGTVRIDPLFDAPEPAACLLRQRHVRAGCAYRVAHPPAWPNVDRDGRLRLGAELGRARRGNRRVTSIWCPPGEKHWHGATPTTAMTHIAIQEKLDGKPWSGWRRSATSSTGPDVREGGTGAEANTRKEQSGSVRALGLGCMGMSFGYGPPARSRR